MTTEERLEKLERKVVATRQWLVGGLLIAVMGTLLLERILSRGSSIVADSIRTRHFVLQDEQGNTDAMLSSFWDGQPSLVLLGEDGESCVLIGMSKQGPHLSLYDGMGKRRAALVVTEEGPTLGLYDDDEEEHVRLAVSDFEDFKNMPALMLFDRGVKMRVLIGVGLEEAGLTLYDEKGNSIWTAP